MKIIMLGAPGAGKGTQAKMIAEKYQIPHVSTGDIFRANIKNGTELGMEAKKYMDQGLLVPDELTVKILLDRVAQEDCKNGYVQGLRLVVIYFQAVLYRFGLIIIPQHQRLTAVIAYALLLGRNMLDMIGGATGETRSSPGHSLNNILIRHIHIDGIINLLTQLGQSLIQHLRLGYGAGVLKTVDGTVDMKDVFEAIVSILG